MIRLYKCDRGSRIICWCLLMTMWKKIFYIIWILQILNILLSEFSNASCILIIHLKYFKYLGYLACCQYLGFLYISDFWNLLNVSHVLCIFRFLNVSLVLDILCALNILDTYFEYHRCFKYLEPLRSLNVTNIRPPISKQYQPTLRI